jgi:hypothetical protein
MVGPSVPNSSNYAGPQQKNLQKSPAQQSQNQIDGSGQSVFASTLLNQSQQPQMQKKLIYKKWWFWLIIALTLLLVIGGTIGTVLFVQAKASEHEAAVAAERESIIADYIDGQHRNYGWPENSITCRDVGKGELVVISFNSDTTSFEMPSADTAGQQVEAEMLSSSLETNVIILYISNDGYLFSASLAKYEESTPEAISRYSQYIESIREYADDYAVKNREQWYNGFCDYNATEYGWQSPYEYIDEGIYNENNNLISFYFFNEYATKEVLHVTEFASEADYEEFLQAWQYTANYASLTLCADIDILLVGNFSVNGTLVDAGLKFHANRLDYFSVESD